MKIEVHAKNLPDTDILRSYTRRRLGFALDRFESKIKTIQVLLADINGPRGGKDKCCSIQVFCENAPNAFVESVDDDIYSVIDKASKRVNRMMTSLVKKKQTREKAIPNNRQFDYQQSNIEELTSRV